MSKTENPIRPNPTQELPPIDKKVKLPHQVRLAAARAEDLIAGKRTRSVPKPKTRSEPKVPYTDAQLDEVLARWDQGNLNVTDPDFGIIIELAREGARLTKAHRRGARTPRKTSDEVTRRLEALFEACSELSPKLLKHLTGQPTIEHLRKAVIRKLGLTDGDKVLPEEVIRQDIRLVRPLLRLVQKGVIPPIGKPKGQGPSEKTRREMEAGRAALANAAGANTAPEPPDIPLKLRLRDDC
jgi:hypothetical protein